MYMQPNANYPAQKRIYVFLTKSRYGIQYNKIKSENEKRRAETGVKF